MRKLIEKKETKIWVLRDTDQSWKLVKQWLENIDERKLKFCKYIFCQSLLPYLTWKELEYRRRTRLRAFTKTNFFFLTASVCGSYANRFAFLEGRRNEKRTNSPRDRHRRSFSLDFTYLLIRFRRLSFYFILFFKFTFRLIYENSI